MPYLEKKTKVRNKVYVEKVYSARYGKNTIPGPKEKKTKDKVKSQQQRERVKKLNWLLEENFEPGDWHITLTFAKDQRTTDQKKLQEIKKEFMKEMRKIYRTAGKELKYICVQEHLKTTVHYHMVINDIPDLHKKLPKIWRKGRMYMEPLYESECGFKQLASYLLKEKADGKKQKGAMSYTRSRNLTVPETKVRVIRNVRWKKYPKPPRGYEIDPHSVKEYVDKFGYLKQTYTLMQISPKRRI